MIWEELSYNKYNCPFESQEDDEQYRLREVEENYVNISEAAISYEMIKNHCTKKEDSNWQVFSF